MRRVSANTPLFGESSSPGKGNALEYVTVTTRLWKDRWVRGLSTDSKLLWLYLITHDSDYGFYEYDPEAWELETGLSVSTIADCLAEFASAGKVAMHGDLVLVIKALQHRRLSRRDYDYALSAVSKRYGLRAPSLVSLCLQRNPADSAGVNGTPLLSVSESESDQNQNTSCRKVKRVKPVIRPYSELITELAPECRIAWDSFISMVASHNATGSLAETRMARLLDSLLTHAQDERLSILQLNYGLTAALAANEGKGVPNIMYAIKAARSKSNEIQ